MPATDSSKKHRTHDAAFFTTRWSVVLAAQGNASRDAFQSLEALCQQYWPPLYAYVRRRGLSPHDAEDLTQAFFARLLEKEWVTAARQERGRFRAFLLMALRHFMANEWDRSQARKRGGGCEFISLNTEIAERAYIAHPASSPAESLYEKRWALTLLETVMHRLKSEHEAVGKLAEYEVLKPCLTADRGEIQYEDIATMLRVEPVSARSAVHRLRKRFREIFRSEIAGTVANPADVDAEMRAVIAALGSE